MSTWAMFVSTVFQTTKAVNDEGLDIERVGIYANAWLTLLNVAYASKNK